VVSGESARGRRPHGIGVAIVRGRSMEPTLRDGDRLVVRYGAAPRPGQVALVQLPGRDGISVKRVLRREPDGWWVERDNPAEGVDSWLVGAVPPDGVMAVAIGRIWPRPRLLRIR
jgi:phage repressor protein C with HTH and peptisase S24 domain